MIISNVIGGLGNQMFQYAAGRALSLKLGINFKIDISDFEGYLLHNGFELNRIFNCNPGIATKADIKEILGWQSNSIAKKLMRRNLLKFVANKNYVREPHFHYYDSFFQLPDQSYLDGYWQSYKYFNEYKSIISKDFTFKVPLNIKNQAIIDDINKNQSVSIHVRRGDYISNKKNQTIFAECGIDYYNKAIKTVVNNIENPVFYIFSNDIIWVKKNLNIDYKHVYISNNKNQSSYVDMQLMAACKHNIIANSSFSWWAAQLNNYQNKIVIYPTKWFLDSKSILDLCQSNWIGQ